MQKQSKSPKYYQLMFLLFAAAAGLLISLFIREYTKHDGLPVGRLPLMLVSLGFLAYYGKQLIIRRNGRK